MSSSASAAQSQASRGGGASSPSSGAGRLTRDEVLCIGHGRSPREGVPGGAWAFVPLAELLLRASPGDHEARFLLAANYARLGLVTASQEHLQFIESSIGSDPQIDALRGAMKDLPPDRIASESLLAMASANIAALAERGIDLFSEFTSQREALTKYEVFQTLCGERVRRATGRAGRVGASWELWGEHRAQAAAFAKTHLGASGDREQSCVVEGVEPPWLLLAVAEARIEQPDGFRPALRVVVPDATSLIRALTLADLRSVILDERAWWFVGQRSGEQLAEHFAQRLGCVERCSLIVTPSTTRRSSPDTMSILESFTIEQEREIEATRQRVLRSYDARDQAFWRNRYASASTQNPLRVLIPTTRYSTFLQHSAADIAEAFRAVGIDARVLIEPDGAARFCSLAFLREIDRFDPDAILSINFTRHDINAMAGGGTDDASRVIPPHVPMITWVQDAMVHLKRSGAAASLSELDFVVGHVHPEMLGEDPRAHARFLPSPVLASEAKFTDTQADADLASTYRCEIVAITHQSQTPGRFVQSLLHQPSASAEARRAIEDIARHVPGLCDRAWNEGVFEPARSMVEQAVRRAGLSGDQAVGIVMSQVAIPLIDRTLRHQAFEWAARVATRRNWRFHLHGRGWNLHPTLSAFAKPEVPHDASLHAAYQSASVCMHVSAHGYLHQRVMECALSGGLPITRLTREDVFKLEHHARVWLPERTLATFSSVLDRRTYVHAVDHFLGFRLLAQSQRLGIPRSQMVHVDYALSGDLKKSQGFGALSPDAAWLLGDLCETGFRDEGELESRIEAAVDSPDRRKNLSTGIARRVKAQFSMTSFCTSIVSMMKSSFESAVRRTGGSL